ncbi:amphi-Trp domain-containing protein [Magnetococcus sp. PR-3]|uniref:amphi-Trp domain-containing protein n=1 Tax=Magnetococcus sp. PR-3 TaxID=3120355 RepID=UPI002FCE3732
MKRNKSFTHKSLQDSKQVKKVLRALLKGVEEGTLTFGQGEDEVQLTPEGVMQMKVSASRDQGKQKMTLRLSWQEQENKPTRKSPSIKS